MQYLIERAEAKVSKTNKNFILLTGNTGAERQTIYLWEIGNCDPTALIGKIMDTVPRESNGFLSANYADCRFHDLKQLPEDHPIRQIETVGKYNSDDLWNLIQETAAEFEMPDTFRAYFASQALKDDIADYSNYPAGAKAHHAYKNGLSTHTYEAVSIARQLAKNECFAGIKFHISLAALIYHDWGKIKEYASEAPWTYQSAMPLHGHIYLSAKRFHDQFVKTIPSGTPANSETMRDVDFVEHAILAHHGKLEFGSPVVPANAEAYLVHVADAISASTHQYRNTYNMERNFFVGATVVKK
ncbi:3'-5' exoribonuclease YhaM [Bacteroidia bacterium]|nr:3'-5' exoribonuclease YhaM [Bacteroidia bacterium]